ncbi:MAG: winged helix-turn-helix domain-containing protein [Nitriliruptorales bacterium]|nr:winged helix-turn-helix domain-containing protein [Nitriliruptorales bacterium]
MPPDALSTSQARRIALAAQGFTDRAPSSRVDRRHLRRAIDRTGLLQLDSVNVLARAHYMPPFSRLGGYPVDTLDAMAYGDGDYFEYWGHEASLLPVQLHPLLRWRMARAERGETWGGPASIARERPDFVAAVLAQVGRRGPVRVSDLEDGPRVRRGTMWDWSDTKKALEWLFWTGQVAVAGRVNFERRYDLTERVLPAAVLAAPTPTEEEAHRELLVFAAQRHGVGAARDLADYLRLPIVDARRRLAELVEDGRLRPVTVQGWKEPAYLHPGAKLPRWVRAQALLSPFDPVVWERSRIWRLFHFHYRIEIYVPAPKRVWGYYVFPFLLGDRLVGRVDLKADRGAGRLLVHGAWREEHADPAATATALAEELAALAQWLDLGAVEVADRGDLSPTLRKIIARQTSCA